MPNVTATMNNAPEIICNIVGQQRMAALDAVDGSSPWGANNMGSVADGVTMIRGR